MYIFSTETDGSSYGFILFKTWTNSSKNTAQAVATGYRFSVRILEADNIGNKDYMKL